MMRYPGEKWIKITRVWTLVTWLFLTCGIFLGMHWAYAVLGWGGYWGWDPVENASFMPWLTGTAFLHSVMMQERKGMMKSWNVWLIFSTFLLTLLGTLLTRAGLVSSVHAFAQSPIGTWFYVFMGIVLAVCIFTYVLQRNHLKSDQHLESLVSRESSFLFNNLVLLAACFVILWGTLFPILSEYVQGSKVTVGAPFYNRVAVPIGLFLLFLTGVGPLLPWRSTSLRAIRRNFILPIIALWATVIVCIAVGASPWKNGAFDSGNFYALVGFSLCRRCLHRHPLRIPPRRRRHRETDRPQSLLAPRCCSLAATPAATADTSSTSASSSSSSASAARPSTAARSASSPLHGTLPIGPYTLECVGFTQDSNPNYNSEYAMLDVYKSGKKTLPDDARKTRLHRQPAAADHGRHPLRSGLGSLRGLRRHAIPTPASPSSRRSSIRSVGWIWAGVVIIVFGTFIALVAQPLSCHRVSSRPRRHRSTRRAGA